MRFLLIDRVIQEEDFSVCYMHNIVEIFLANDALGPILSPASTQFFWVIVLRQLHFHIYYLIVEISL
jgi:hypothetical protein